MYRKTTAQYVLAAILGLFALIGLLPLVLVVIASFSSQQSIAEKGFSFFPSGWSLDAWNYVFQSGFQILKSYGVSIAVTVVGTFLALLFMSMIAFALSRRNFVMRKFLSVYILITMLFSGGMLAQYLVNVQVWHLKNTFWVLIFPGVNAMQIIILRTFIQSNVPDSLTEAARIDGAGELRTFFQIVIPIMKPALAAVGFMLAVSYWNDWQRGYLYITDNNLTQLQLLMIRIEKNIEFLLDNSNATPEIIAMRTSIPQDTSRMAIMLICAGPILIAYPFFQKYFVKGLTVGSVKG